MTVPADGGNRGGRKTKTENHQQPHPNGISVRTQARTHLRELHIELVRDFLKKGPIPLALTRLDRDGWRRVGLTLRQRDEATRWLVQHDEAEYKLLMDRRTAPTMRIPFLVAVAPGGAA